MSTVTMSPVRIPFILVLAALTIFSSCTSTQKEIPADHEDIFIMGRHLSKDNGNIEFDWPGITIHANFSGTSISILMDDTHKNFYNVFVDDREVEIIEVHSDTCLLLAENLPNEEHRLRLVKRTEGEQGLATFKGLILDKKGEILEAPLRSDRKIEFIGNSITCGYGTDSYDKNEAFTPETEDCYKAHGAITARAFEAEYHLVSHSGQGVVRNYGDKNPLSDYVMPDRYKQVFDLQKEPLWDFNSWTPDAVVINLGTNDFSTQPHPDEASFISGYNELIDFVRSNYGELPIFCLVGPMTDEPSHTYVKKMVRIRNGSGEDKNIHFIHIPRSLMIADEDLGASYHPNYPGQIKMSKHYVPVISSVMGWEYEFVD